MNRSLLETHGTLGVPSAEAEPLVGALAVEACALGAPVVGGRFGAHMEISLVNDGPVTILLDTTKVF